MENSNKIDYEILGYMDCGLEGQNNIIEDTNVDLLPVDAGRMVQLMSKIVTDIKGKHNLDVMGCAVSPTAIDIVYVCETEPLLNGDIQMDVSLIRMLPKKDNLPKIGEMYKALDMQGYALFVERGNGFTIDMPIDPALIAVA